MHYSNNSVAQGSRDYVYDTFLQERIGFTFRRFAFCVEQADDIVPLANEKPLIVTLIVRQTRIAKCDTTGIVRIR